MTAQTSTFAQALETHGLGLKKQETKILQINTGLLCNQFCKHCHLDAGPDKTELMDRQTMDQVIEFQKKYQIATIDITGGAPELNPDLSYLIENIAGLAPKVMLRSNLSALYEKKDKGLLDTLIKNKIVIVSSFPALNAAQTDAQRGLGTFDKSIKMLQMLNQAGYGQKGKGLELNLVANPSGAFLPSSQEATQKRYRKVLAEKWGIVFNEAYCFANMPLGRFKDWLLKSENFTQYMDKLAQSFNPCTIEGLMCRFLISVSWDGYLYDCDFNLAANLPKSNKKIHISQVDTCSFEGDEIAIQDHCFACTAGTGFT